MNYKSILEHRLLVAKTAYKFFKCNSNRKRFEALVAMTPQQKKYLMAFVDFADKLN